jgi:hypothetical protein
VDLSLWKKQGGFKQEIGGVTLFSDFDDVKVHCRMRFVSPLSRYMKVLLSKLRGCHVFIEAISRFCEGAERVAMAAKANKNWW